MTSGDILLGRSSTGNTAIGESLATRLGYWSGIHGDDIAMTFLDYRDSVDGTAVSLSWRELDEKVSAAAAWIQQRAGRADRVAVLAPQSLDYATAFLGAIRAGTIAVPLFLPSLPGHAGRLATVLQDCAPELVLTTADELDAVNEFLAAQGIPVPMVAAVDEVPDDLAGDCAPINPAPDDVAYLQYTSGSTRTPSGVVLTHRNVLANAEQAYAAYDAERGHTSLVSWLPLFHDMGLMLGIAEAAACGISSTMMDPVAFLERPLRWLQALSANPGAISAAPNFAYAYAASRVQDKDKVYLDLGHVVSLINGSEPVLPSTIARFADAFAECGLKPTVHRSSYGLAEATVLVSVSDSGAGPREVAFDRDELAAGRAVAAGATTVNVSTLVSCGHPIDQQVRIVDVDSCGVVDNGTVGEIWITGPNVGHGYWRGTDRSAETFGLTLGIGTQADAGFEGSGWLATGDLGVLYDGELYMTGRIKDLIIVDGRNHYPQDIEETVQAAHPAVRPHAVGAFAAPGPEGEVVVLMVERAKGVDAEGLDHRELTATLRSAVSAGHGVRLHDVLVLEPGQVPRTSSGKISRVGCRQRYLAGTSGERAAE